MPYVPPDVLEKVKGIDLLTYLENYEPNNLVKVSSGVYSTREHDSVKISNGMWYRWATGVGGKSALDYLIKVRGLSLYDAVEMIQGRVEQQAPTFAKIEFKVKSDKLILPEISKHPSKVPHYLKYQRGIDSEIVDYCFDNGLVLESSPPYHNALFVGYDEHGEARYAAFRASNSKHIMGDCLGSNKEYSFRIVGNEQDNKIHFFECAIDLLSYATLLKNKGKDWQSYNLISLAGVYQPKKEITESKLPIALVKYLDDHPQVNTIYLHLDNDWVGREATRTIKTLLPNDIKVIDSPPPNGKDVNSYLLSLRDYSKPNPSKNWDIER